MKQQQEEVENVPRGCELCEGTGMRYTRKLVNRTALDADGNPYVYDSYYADCQERCSCALGRFLKAKESLAASDIKATAGSAR
jgi:hypothetical protein